MRSTHSGRKQKKRGENGFEASHGIVCLNTSSFLNYFFLGGECTLRRLTFNVRAELLIEIATSIEKKHGRKESGSSYGMGVGSNPTSGKKTPALQKVEYGPCGRFQSTFYVSAIFQLCEQS